MPPGVYRPQEGACGYRPFSHLCHLSKGFGEGVYLLQEEALWQGEGRERLMIKSEAEWGKVGVRRAGRHVLHER